MLGGDKGKVNVQWHSGLGQLSHNWHIELRIIPLYVSSAVSRNFSITDLTVLLDGNG